MRCGEMSSRRPRAAGHSRGRDRHTGSPPDQRYSGERRCRLTPKTRQTASKGLEVLQDRASAGTSNLFLAIERSMYTWKIPAPPATCAVRNESPPPDVDVEHLGSQKNAGLDCHREKSESRQVGAGRETPCPVHLTTATPHERSQNGFAGSRSCRVPT